MKKKLLLSHFILLTILLFGQNYPFDACLGWSNNQILFFKESYYVQYDITKNSSDTPEEIIHSLMALPSQKPDKNKQL